MDNLPSAKNYKLPAIVFTIVLFVIFAVLKVIPAVWTFFNAFKEYSPAMGGQSPFVGMRNFEMLFNSAQFFPSVVNSILLSLMGTIIPLVLAFLSSVMLARLDNRTAMLTAGLILLPVFIPDITLSALIMKLFPSMLMNPSTSRFAYLIIVWLKVFCYGTFLGTVFAVFSKRKGKHVYLGCGIGILTVFGFSAYSIFSPSFEVIYSLTNPMNFDSLSTLDFMSFRSGLMNMQISFASAVHIIKLLLSLPFAVIFSVVFFFVIRAYLKKPASSLHAPAVPTEARKIPAVMLIVGAAAVIIAIASLVMIFGTGGIEQVLPSLVPTLIITIITALLSIALSSAGSYGLYRLFTPFGLIITGLILFVGTSIIGEFMFNRSLGLINTLVPVVSGGIINGTIILSLTVTALILFSSELNVSPGRYIKDMLPFIIIALALTLSGVLNDTAVPLVNISDSRLFTLSLLSRQALQGGQNFGSAAAPLILTLLSLLIGAGGICGFILLQRRVQD